MPGPGYKAKSKGGPGYTGSKKARKKVRRAVKASVPASSSPKRVQKAIKVKRRASGEDFARKRARGDATRRTLLEQVQRDSTKLPTSLTREQQERSARAFGHEKLRSAPEGIVDLALDVAKEGATWTPAGRVAKAGSLASKVIKGFATKTSKTDKLAAKATKLERKAEAAAKAGKTRKARRAQKVKAKAQEKMARRDRKAVERMERAMKSRRERAKDLWRAKQPAVLTKAGRQVKRRKRAAGTAALGAAAGGTMAPVALNTAATTGEAVRRDVKEGKPLRTVGTTVRVLPGMPAAVVSDATDLAKAAAGDKEAWEEFKKSQTDYYKTLTKVASGGEEGVKAVQEDVGLIPAISGALTIGAAAKALGGVPAPDGIRARRARSLDRKARTAATKKERQALEAKRAKVKAPSGQRRRIRMQEAKRAAATKERQQRMLQVEMGRGRKSFNRRVVKLSKRPVTKDVSKAELIGVLGREGLYGRNPDFILREVKRRRANLKEPSHSPREAAVTTRDVYDAIIENPAILRDLDDMREAIRQKAEIERGRSIERYTERTGRDQDSPDPLDERARLLHVANAEDIRFPEERIPEPLRGKTRVKPKRGQDAKKAIRAEAHAELKQAAALRRKARAEEQQARAVAREIKALRSADDRRVSIRTKNRKLRTLEKRRAAWSEKAKRARRPDTRKRYEAKVRDLDRQIRDTKATLKMSASRNRLRAVARAARHRERAAELRERAEITELEAKVKRELVNRLRKAEALDRRATALENGAKPRKGEASPAVLRQQAEALRRAYMEDERKLLEEFVEETQARIKEKGYEQPVYFREMDARDEGDLNVAQDYMGGNIPPREHMRTGELARQGVIDESAATTLETTIRARQAMEMRRHVRSFLDDNLIEVDGKTIRTGREWRKLQSEGKLPPDVDLFPLQEWNRILQRGSWEEAQGLLDDPLMHEVRVSRGEAGKKYALVPREAKAEFRKQMERGNVLLRIGRMAARVQSIAMLGFSPIWFQMQLVASPIATAFAHPNPVRWAKVATKMAREWRKVPKKERAYFQAEFGGTSADMFDLLDSRITVSPNTTRTMAGASRVAAQTPVGRLLRGLARGGPLIAANRRYEAAWRTFVAMLEADKQINPSRAKRAVQAIAGVYDETHKHLQHLKGKSQKEIVAYYNRNPQAMKRLVEAIDDANGNWNALTSRERLSAVLFVFYPFLRFSNKWALMAAPKNRPLLYAAILNSAQSNAMELDAMGEGDFFSDWGKGVIHGSGEDTTIDLGRIAPGANALMEVIGGGQEFNLGTLTRPLQPLIGGTLTALSGDDPYGRESDLGIGLQLLKNLATLSAPTRPLGEKIDPPSDTAKMFRRLEGRDRSNLEKLFVPDLIGSPSESKDSARLSELLDIAAQRPSSSEIFNADPEDIPELRKRQRAAEKAQKEIDQMKIDLGLTTPRELRRVKRKGSKNYSKVRYKRSSSGFGGSAFGGSGFGGSAFR